MKAAAKAVGVEGLLSLGTPLSEAVPPEDFFHDKWYGSLPQIAFDATREAKSKYEATRYAHMKSWGAGFRHSVIRRELIVENMFQQKISRDRGSLEKIIDFFR